MSFRYRLRTLFLVLVLCAPVLMIGRDWAARRSAIRQLANSGEVDGNVRAWSTDRTCALRDFERLSWSVQSLCVPVVDFAMFASAEGDSCDASQLAAFQSLRCAELTIFDTRIVARDIRALKDLRLKSLGLEYCTLSGDAATAIAALPTIESLSLKHSHIAEEDVDKLRKQRQWKDFSTWDVKPTRPAD